MLSTIKSNYLLFSKTDHYSVKLYLGYCNNQRKFNRSELKSDQHERKYNSKKELMRIRITEIMYNNARAL